MTMIAQSIRLVSRAWPVAVRAALAVALTTVSLLIASAPARAAERTGDEAPLQFVVRYTDLDLQTEAGALALYTRISTAARRVCPDEGSRNLQWLAAIRACRAQAIDRAVSGIGSEKLAAIHAARMQRGSVA